MQRGSTVWKPSISELIMRTITEIEHTKTWTKYGVIHYRTYAILDNQDEAIGYGQFKVGDKVEAWFNDKWDYLQIKKPKTPKPVANDNQPKDTTAHTL